MIDLNGLEKHLQELIDGGNGEGRYTKAENVMLLVKRLRESEKDAARYRWLRDYHIGDDPQSINMDGNSGLDEAIDEAMQCK